MVYFRFVCYLGAVNIMQLMFGLFGIIVINALKIAEKALAMLGDFWTISQALITIIPSKTLTFNTLLLIISPLTKGLLYCRYSIFPLELRVLLRDDLANVLRI